MLPAAAKQRLYKHAEKQACLDKSAHNDWVTQAAYTNMPAAVVVLDGVDLNTTQTLIAAGIPCEAIHVPNRSDFDAIVSHGHPRHGNLYRGAVQTLVEACSQISDTDRVPIRTVWLDYTGRWGQHVVRTLEMMFGCRMLGVGRSDLFITLSCDPRSTAAKPLEEVQELVEALAVSFGIAVEFEEKHTTNYGRNMFIIHALLQCDVMESRVEQPPVGSLYGQLRQTQAFRKAPNSVCAV